MPATVRARSLGLWIGWFGLGLTLLLPACQSYCRHGHLPAKIDRAAYVALALRADVWVPKQPDTVPISIQIVAVNNNYHQKRTKWSPIEWQLLTLDGDLCAEGKLRFGPVYASESVELFEETIDIPGACLEVGVTYKLRAIHQQSQVQDDWIFWVPAVPDDLRPSRRPFQSALAIISMGVDPRVTRVPQGTTISCSIVLVATNPGFIQPSWTIAHPTHPLSGVFLTQPISIGPLSVFDEPILLPSGALIPYHDHTVTVQVGPATATDWIRWEPSGPRRPRPPVSGRLDAEPNSPRPAYPCTRSGRDRIDEHQPACRPDSSGRSCLVLDPARGSERGEQR